LIDHLNFLTANEGNIPAFRSARHRFVFFNDAKKGEPEGSPFSLGGCFARSSQNVTFTPP
jgi:hypothetical protein